MSDTVVVFQSKYGTTEKYARWIAEALRCDLLERKNTKAEDLKAYDTIIYGGGHMEVLNRQDIGTKVSIVIPKSGNPLEPGKDRDTAV